jgi:hypothetical protein
LRASELTYVHAKLRESLVPLAHMTHLNLIRETALPQPMNGCASAAFFARTFSVSIASGHPQAKLSRMAPLTLNDSLQHDR